VSARGYIPHIRLRGEEVSESEHPPDFIPRRWGGVFPLLNQPLSETDATLRENRFVLPRLATSGGRHEYSQHDHHYLRMNTKGACHTSNPAPLA
jgi:hypothetical protein